MAAIVVVTYLAHKGGKKREEIGIAGVFVPFSRTLLGTGRSVMRAEVEAGSPVHQACLANPVFTVLSREAGAELSPAGTVTVPTASRDADDPFPLVTAARRNGWAYADMTGAGENNVWDERGGRGERSGLSMAELALCVPPPGWFPSASEPGEAVPGLCDTHWPWEVPGFSAPGVGWRPPVLRSKRRLADDVPPADEVPAATEPSVEPEPEPEPRAEDVPKRATRAKPPETRTDEVLADVSEERRANAVAKLLALWSAGNQAPSVNKAQHALKKAGFDFTKAQVEALLNEAGTQARAVTAPS